MRHFVFSLTIWVLVLAGGRSRAADFREGMVLTFPSRETTTDTFRVLTWNMDHFVDPYDSPYIHNQWDDKLVGMTPHRVDLFVKAIRGINADVVALEEFESSAYLKELAKTRFPEMGYTHFAADEDLTWHQNVIIMSRFPLGTVYSFGDVPTAIEGETNANGSPAAETLTNHRLIAAEVFVNKDYDFLLLALHLKAGRGPRNRGWRLGQIDFLRDWLKNYQTWRPNSNILVVGDFNSAPGSTEYEHLTANNSKAGFHFIDPLHGQNVPTDPSSHPRRRIDYILPNPAMAPEYVGNSLTTPTPLPREDMVTVSDHLPVLAIYRDKNR